MTTFPAPSEMLTLILEIVASLIGINQGYGFFIKVRAEISKMKAEENKISIETIRELWDAIDGLEKRIAKEISLRQALQERIQLLEGILRKHNIPIPSEGRELVEEETKPISYGGFGGMKRK